MNLYTFLVENREAIESIPSLLERIKALEADSHINYYGPTDTEPDHNPGVVVEEFAVDAEGFDQGDHDELFADGGATERSFDSKDHAEIFAPLRQAGDEAPTYDPDRENGPDVQETGAIIPVT